MTRQMKSSGIDWIGDIPSDWSMEKLKFLSRIQTGNKDTVDRNPDGCYPFFVRSETIERIDSYSYDGEAILTAGDGDIGKIFHYVDSKFDYHQRVYNICCFSNKIMGKFLYYYISNNFIKELEKYNAKTTVDSIRRPWLANFLIVFPSLTEQQKIVKYLDRQTDRVSEIIDKIKKEIELLKELRSSVITHAVTKGLDPKADMQATGIDWLGDIPNGWELRRLKTFAEICNGQVFKDVEDGNIPVIGSGGEFARTDKCLYDKVSVLLGRKGTIDNPLFIDFPFWSVDTMFYTKIKSGVNPKFFYYLCKTINFDFYLYGSAVPSMTQRDLNEVRFPYPPIEEQQAIADYLDGRTAEIDSAISTKEQIINKLTEYKKSLIYEVVTGKKEVV